jgi:hypothetical protein
MLAIERVILLLIAHKTKHSSYAFKQENNNYETFYFLFK